MQRLQSKQEESTEEEEMKQQQRMAIMKDLMKKIRSKGRMGAWAHRGWEDTMQKRYEWLEYEKRKDEKEKMEEMHQRKVEKMIKSAEGSAGLLLKIRKPTICRGGVQILKEEEEDARLLDRCEAKKREWSKHWQRDEETQNMQSKPWRNDELKKCEKRCPD